MKTLKHIILFVLIIAVCFSSVNSSGADNSITNSTTISNSSVFESDLPDQYLFICENDRFSLSYREDITSIALTDKLSGRMWYSAVNEELYDIKNSSKTWQTYMQSILSIKYVSKKDTRGNFINDYSAAKDNAVFAEKLENGLKLRISFRDSAIDLTLKIELEEDHVKLSVPIDEIKENGEYSIVSVELLPFFGAAAKDADGYIVYPDGSGAISYFNETDNKHQFTKQYTIDVYSLLDHEKIFDETNEENCAMLPIYGIKNEKNAFLAVITKGDSSAKINVNTSVNSSAVKLNRASFEFVYRNQYRIYLSNIIINGRSRTTNPYGVKVDKDMIQLDCEVKLFFLNDDVANYSGMANVYRDYLIKEGLLKKSKLQDEVGLALNVFMGTREEKTFLKKFVNMTTFDEVNRIASDYLNNDIANLQIMLRGWSKNGYYNQPNIATPDNHLGGSAGLKRLAALDKENDKLFLYLETNVNSASKSSGGFSTGRDVVLQGNKIPVSHNKSKFLINAKKMESLYENALIKMSANLPIGVALAKAGSFITHDYNKSFGLQRSDNIEVWKNMISQTYSNVAAQGGNLYTLALVDRLYDIPIESSMNQITDESIPWYQMIVYGSIPYTSEPGNLSYDLELLKLKWIEYGCMPYFEVTVRNPLNLKNTSYNTLFTSENSKWREVILDIYNEWKSKLEPIQNTFMIKHEKLTEDITQITYENGYQVIINFSFSKINYNNMEIPARDYILVGGAYN